MSSTENLIKATLNRLSARFGQSLISSIAELAVLAKDVPERLQKEWELFQEEVIAEADRLQKESEEEQTTNNKASTISEFETPEEKIAQLRAKVSELSKKIEVKP